LLVISYSIVTTRFGRRAPNQPPTTGGDSGHHHSHSDSCSHHSPHDAGSCDCGHCDCGGHHWHTLRPQRMDSAKTPRRHLRFAGRRPRNSRPKTPHGLDYL